jgi:spermidine synthase
MTPVTMRRTGIAVVAFCAALLLYMLIAGQRTRTLFTSDSPFGAVRVTEQSDGLRSLLTGEGRARQTAMYPDRPLHLIHAYTRVGMVGLALVPPDARILFVGLGGGAMPTYTHRVMPQARIDVVEIDPIIVDVAQRFFNFTPDDRMAVHTDDGRAFIESATPGSYDLIVLDAFSDDEVPYSLTTRQFLTAVHTALAADGVVVSNLWTAAPAYRGMLATYDAVFDQVRLIRVPQRAQRILVGSKGRTLDRNALAAATRALAERTDLGFDLADLVDDGYEDLPTHDAAVLEDRD